jgi:hypothetical protein
MPGVFSQFQAAYTETRPSPSVRRRITAQAAERDGWLCHRCGLPIDRHERWPTRWPWSMTITRCHAVAAARTTWPTSAAHSLCNGSTSGIRPQAIPFTVTTAQPEVINQILAGEGAQDR